MRPKGCGATQTLGLKRAACADSTPWKVDCYEGSNLLFTHTFDSPPAVSRLVIGAGGATAIAGRFDNLSAIVLP
ncbi:MAG: hypothetical protein WC334_11405 [Kiritimatiellales bacterium]